MTDNRKLITENRKAYHNYEILETLECGIVLTGLEIKAIRSGRVNLGGAHAKILSGENQTSELYLINMNINTGAKEDSTKSRKLLVHREQINHLIGKTQEKRLTLVPTKIYLKNGKAKVAIGIARGKKLHDKREDIKLKDAKREMDRAMKI